MVNVTLFGDLDAVEQDARGALDRANQPCLHDRLSWFRLLERHCPPKGQLQAVRAEQDGQRAWLFLAADGRNADAYAAWYSLRFGLIGDRSLAPVIAGFLRSKGLTKVEMVPVEAPDPLISAFHDAGWSISVEPAFGNWTARTENGFDDYWSRRPGQLRSTARRKAKAADLDIVIHDRFDAAGWADYESVYRSSWKPEEGSFPFLRALAEQEGAAGTLRLGLAYHQGRPVAAQLWLVEGGVATIHKLAYAEDAKAMSPGTVLGEAMFRRAIDQDGVTLIDYGTGDDAYKRDWMDERRQLWRIIARNPRSLRGLAGIVRQRVRALVGKKASR